MNALVAVAQLLHHGAITIATPHPHKPKTPRKTPLAGVTVIQMDGDVTMWVTRDAAETHLAHVKESVARLLGAKRLLRFTTMAAWVGAAVAQLPWLGTLGEAWLSASAPALIADLAWRFALGLGAIGVGAFRLALVRVLIVIARRAGNLRCLRSSSWSGRIRPKASAQ